MTIAAVAYHRPTSLASACEMGRVYGADGAFLAGGTELLPDMHRGRETARHLIALDAVTELHGARELNGELRIGALTSIAHIARSPVVRAWHEALAEAAAAIGSPPIRSRATIGGNFCRAVPCADTPAPCIVAGARVRLVGPDGPRDVNAEAFFVGSRRTALLPGEVLVEVILPAQPAGSASSYQRFTRRRGSALAVAAVAARVTLSDGIISGVRVAYGAVSATPILSARIEALLVGKVPTEQLLADAAAVSIDEALAPRNTRRSDSLRRDVLPVLARRALETAITRAGGRIA
jgi:CO/xanthine dehydrogenase FAD-binding subunit